MRPKVVVAILLLAVGLLGGIALVAKILRPQSTGASADSGKISPAAVIPPAAVSSNVVLVRAIDPAPMISAAPVAFTNEAPTNDAAANAVYVRQQIQKLDKLSWNSDVESRDAILSELKNNPNKTIRVAALEAAIQFGDRSVVPPMQEIAAQTQDPEEKASILEAIDYINLPSLTEYMAAHPSPPGSGSPARIPRHPHGQTQPPAQPPNSGQ